MVKTGSSYASQSELPLTFGLGSAAKIDGLRVRWPNGRVDTAGSLKANQLVTVREGGGVASTVADQEDHRPVARLRRLSVAPAVQG